MVSALTIGEEAWNDLRALGGFVWTHSDGSMTVHFNRGFKPTKDQLASIRSRSKELKMFVAHRHKLIEESDKRLPLPIPRIRFNLSGDTPCVGSSRLTP